MDFFLEKKVQVLDNMLRQMGSVVVAFSGGVDSSLLLAACQRVLGDKVLAVTATSPTYPAVELEIAKQMSALLGASHLIIATDELQNDEFAANPPRRCYYCKKELFGKLLSLARERKYTWVADGSNCDDAKDYRPGREAGLEMGIRSPLLEAGFTKDNVRQVARELGLFNWDKPAQPCLSSRFPYGHRISLQELARVAQAEEFLRRQGFPELRVRNHREIARIEVPAADIPRLVERQVAGAVSAYFKELGFIYIAVDLEGLRIGSLNEALALVGA